jgi:antiviral helicase SKI2
MFKIFSLPFAVSNNLTRRTKKKDIYVISTPKRPVPLEHYIYAGRDIHKIVDAQGQFLGAGYVTNFVQLRDGKKISCTCRRYKDAGEALKRKQDKEREAAGLPPVVRVGARGGAAQRAAAQRGVPQRGGGRGLAPRRGGVGSSGPRSFQQQDRNIWVHLVGLLRKKELLPVVIFTFSKKRCEENAATLSNTDLSTASEKSEVHVTIEKALTRLKGVCIPIFLSHPFEPTLSRFR